MKRHLVLLFIAFSWGYTAVKAQAPFPTTANVDINRIKAAILVHGDMFWNPALGVAACEFPAGSGKNINFASALWMSGYDGGGKLHTAAQTYRQTGNDYWPGPLDTSDTLTYTTSQNWANIWKVNLTDIQSFLALTTHTTTNTPPAILTWPGKGNTYAAGNGGAPIAITNDMAPFVDLNGNGIYEPLLGEYPAIKGDQALWWVFSDNGPAHTASNGLPLDVEIHAMAYAYSRGTLIDNVIYFDFDIVNKSPNTYTNYRLGLFDDIDLGYAFDDYIGFDSTWRLGIAYNGNENDGETGGFPVNSYGRLMPIAGITMVVLPGDEGPDYVPAGNFTTFNNDNSIIGNPYNDTGFNDYLRGGNLAGVHFTNTFQGPGVPCLTQGSGPATNYLYTGNPSIDSQWSECGCGDPPGDRRFVISTNNFTLNAGGSEHVVMALVTTNLDSNNGCPTANFDSIKIVADTAWSNYYQQATAVKNVTSNNAINIYPNPAYDKLFIESAILNTGDETIIIYNTLGQKVNAPVSKNGQKYETDISRLPCGLYNVLYRSGDMQTTARFVKE